MSASEDKLRDLLEITKALTSERDVDALLTLILNKSRELTGADAGSLYVVEGDQDDATGRKLRFKLAQNDSVEVPVSEFVMDVSTSSIAGYVVLHREALAIDDAYDMDPRLGFSHSRNLDDKLGYHTRSILTAPMINHHDDVIGVIQLINKKTDPTAVLRTAGDCDRFVEPFDARDRDLLLSLASQAGVALENTQLQAEIETMFEGFVDAAVHAIEQRDPTTSGHSRRVSVLTVELARVVDRIGSGRYGWVRFTEDEVEELRIAGLLHDFGKVGVRESVLVKAEKLPPLALELVLERVDRLLGLERSRVLARQLELARAGAPAGRIDELEAPMQELTRKMASYRNAIVRANRPTVLDEGDFAIVDEIASMRIEDERGEPVALLSADEAEYLKIRRGTLTVEEMEEIRAHARHTREFLRRIPWGRRFSRLPAIASAHHEKLDGSGYPTGLREAEIPVQAKMMAIADIFDALTASDRPYKKAVPVARALDILGYEVKDGHLDKDLVAMFVGEKIYRSVIPDAD
jgi:HD-GYP domain-containing protein (c-di-GMP phosphodiesterase class II)